MEEKESNKTYITSEDGFLEEYSQWDKEWVERVKKEEGIEEITKEQEKVIKILREYYETYGLAPMPRILVKKTGFSSSRLLGLFPEGKIGVAYKLAGLSKPTGCS